MKRLLLALGLLLLASPAPAQNAITQEGSVLQNSPVMFRGNNRARQGAGVGGGMTGQIVMTGDSVVGGRCDFSAPLDAAGGYYSLCIEAATGRIIYGGTKSPVQGLSFDINGTTYGFPGPGNGNVMGAAPSIDNDLVLFNGNTGTIIKDGGIHISEVSNHVQHNAALGGTATTKFPRGVWRDDYAAGWGEPPVFYQPSNAACTLNGGNGDNGSQVKSSDNKCWIAQFVGDLNPRQWGCVGDAATNDTGCLQAVVDYASTLTTTKRKVSLAGHFYCVTGITIPGPMELSGPVAGVVAITETNSGLKACSTNAQLITVTGNGVTLSKFALNGLGGNTSTMSYAIKLFGHENRIESMHLNGFCNYIVNVGRHNIIDKNVLTDNVNPTPSSACFGIIDGGDEAQTIGSIYSNNLLTIWGPSATGAYAAGMLFQNSGGPYITNNDIQRTHYGTMIKPLPNKATAFLFFDNTVLGDTTNADGLLIDTQGSGSSVQIVKISNSYIGRSGDWPGTFTWQDARNVTIQSTGGGSISGVHINGLQMNTAALANLAIAGAANINDITIDNSTLCFPGQKTNAPNIALVSNASTLAFRNNTMAAACDSPTFNANTTTAAINFTGGHQNMMITGNFFAGPWQSGQGPLIDSGTALPTTSMNIIKDNFPGDTAPYVLASATVIDPLYYPMVHVTGSVAVKNIRHPWRSRQVYFYVPNGLSFTSGGGGTDPICVTKAIAAGDTAVGFYVPGPDCWAIR